MVVGASWSCLAVAPDDKLVSVFGRSFQNTPSILPVRRHLDSIKCLMKRGSLHWPRVPTERSRLQSVCEPLQGCEVRKVEGYRIVQYFLARQRTASFSPLYFIRIATCMSLWHLSLFPFVPGRVRQR